MPATHANLLVHETSPYLLQHADNPVHWHAWNAAALDLARETRKPILLSIGYSACHWCHVMAHESFEDAATAQLMNELFVNIKVDREERPDLDKIYQAAYQLLTGRSGGWPLTMFLMPDDNTPFYAGTYFPNTPRYNMPAFHEVLRGVAQSFHERRAEIQQQNESLRRALTVPPTHTTAQLTAAPLAGAYEFLARSYDAKYGGFGRAPKFPHPTHLERLLRHGAAQHDPVASGMALHTLRAMAQGGIYDQLGGGFCRYSVDAHWSIPHFEKMLYDNGPLLSLYCDAWRNSGDALFQNVALETAAWVIREMQAPDGGYYASQDADTEGEEGKFYVWTAHEVRAVLQDEAQYALFAGVYGLDGPANFEHRWNLRVNDAAAVVEQDALRVAREKLFAARERRVRPGRDDKIITSWNGLMIKGMAAAGRVFERADLIRSAEQALDFVRCTLWKDGRLFASYKDGRAHLGAYLDDYAFVIDAILELLQARWNDAEFRFALQLAEVLLMQFEDCESGGFFFTAHDHERLILRPKPFHDDALPSGNGIAAHVLVRLGHLLGELRYVQGAQRALQAAWHDINQAPHTCNAMLLALEELLTPGQTVIVRGSAAQLPVWQARCAHGYAPKRLCFAIPNDAALPAALASYAAAPSGVIAYVCSGTQCSPPVMELEKLAAVLRATAPDFNGTKSDV
ncbi:MAG: thioredoxin domain-containing protein [Gammaproteobacteria bacterium]|nr:thioredoxin domain-containing protein [Gammaproteobacteria bacterium]